MIDTTKPWPALETLRNFWQPNSVEALTAAASTLPESPTPIVARTPLHKSKVNPRNHKSVIHWFNDHNDLRSLLLARHGRDPHHGAVHCPWHDDRSPSLVIWRHRGTGHLVCNCFSQNSGCVASGKRYLDAFDVYCLSTGLDPSEAVKRLVEEHGFGRQRELRIEQTQVSPVASEEPLKCHQDLIVQHRSMLTEKLARATEARGRVTVIRATPGLGKTEAAAQRALELHASGKEVAVVAATHELAHTEWEQRLGPHGFVWQSRTNLCTCYTQRHLEILMERGYPLRPCSEGCPYHEQHKAREGKITIYQYNHLYLNGGRLLSGADVVIIDESPLDALVQEHHVTRFELERLAERLESQRHHDPASPLVAALVQVAHHYCPSGRVSLHGTSLLERLRAALPEGLDLLSAIAQARTSPIAQRTAIATRNIDPAHLPRRFLKLFLDVLEHDVGNPEGNTLLAYAHTQRGWGWSWYEPHVLVEAAVNDSDPPAVIVLDGSAHALIAKELYYPWPVEMVHIDLPLSPTVEIVQCGITASTRSILKDHGRLDSLARSVAVVCNGLGIMLDGGVSYLGAIAYLASQLGGEWLHYGGLRGLNALAQARNVAIVASPTVPPDAIERKAQALWRRHAPINTTPPEHYGPGEYRYTDARLQAMADLHTVEELRQAIHRCRLALRTEPTSVVVFSPWDLAAIGLPPNKVVTQLPHGNSDAAREGYLAYQARGASKCG